MAEPLVLSALEAKRAEIAGVIEHHQQAINQARTDLLHIDATLGIFGYAEDPEAIPAKRSVTANLFGRGELQRTIFDLLRTAPDGMTCMALAEAKPSTLHGRALPHGGTGLLSPRLCLASDGLSPFRSPVAEARLRTRAGLLCALIAASVHV